MEVKSNPKANYKELYMRKTELEETNKYQEWCTGVDYNEEEMYYKRRLMLRSYLKDLKELI